MAKPRMDVGDFQKVSIKDFEKLQFRVGKIAQIKPHPKLAKTFVIVVDTAIADEDVQVVAKLGDGYQIGDLLAKQVVVLCNLEPQDIGGEESHGLLLISH